MMKKAYITPQMLSYVMTANTELLAGSNVVKGLDNDFEGFAGEGTNGDEADSRRWGSIWDDDEDSL